MVEVAWSVGRRTARVEPADEDWTDDDLRAASSVVRWLERHPRTG